MNQLDKFKNYIDERKENVKIGLVGIGIAAQPALLFAFAVHTAQTLMTIIFGIISSLLLLSHNKSKNE